MSRVFPESEPSQRQRDGSAVCNQMARLVGKLGDDDDDFL